MFSAWFDSLFTVVVVYLGLMLEIFLFLIFLISFEFVVVEIRVVQCL